MKKIILVIDDDDILRTSLSSGLRSNGFDVLTAESAETAISLLTRIQVDAIVLDRMLGRMDGLTFLKNFRTHNTKTPIIMLTALGGPDNTIEGLSNGANDYMAKPFKLQELVLRLNNIIPKNDDKFDDFTNITISNNDFFAVHDKKSKPILLNLSDTEKQLLRNLITPIGNIVSAPPMVAKRLRSKLNVVLSDLDIITIRGQGYKIIPLNKQNGEKK